ncbi:MAG: hypothetical protein WBQ23_09685 [Bacteroidota bacterium]
MLRFILSPLLFIVLFQSTLAQPTLTFDASHRARFVGWDKGLGGSLGAPMQFTTNRTRAGLTWRPAASLELRAALLNEFVGWIETPVERPFKMDEVVFEHLYLRWHDTLGIPVSATVGRQDIRFGEGFILFEGAPLDGSRSIYVNGARADFEPAEGHRITLLYLHQPMTDDILPIINDQSRPLAEYTRDIGGLYYTGLASGFGLEAYVLRSGGESDPWLANAGERDAHITSTTMGVRAERSFPSGLRMQAEAAYQRSEVRAFNSYFRTSDAGGEGYSAFPFDGVALNGDIGWTSPDPDLCGLSARIGMFRYSSQWDPLLGRWPKWNESIVYSKGILIASGYWSNTRAAFLEVSARPHSTLRVVGKLQLLSHESGARSFPGGASPDIGRLAALYCFWKPDLPISASLWIERMWFDNRFISASQSGLAAGYTWGRIELLYTLPNVPLLD